ncbi:ATP synthase F0 subunit B [Streptomyces sp. NPDC058572]|uniref:ATP synthase F0 subunit B n=1 Tax=Streptomyces sp. NPDC058572 TaxID=3346546 RepID=UPI00364A9653
MTSGIDLSTLRPAPRPQSLNGHVLFGTQVGADQALADAKRHAAEVLQAATERVERRQAEADRIHSDAEAAAARLIEDARKSATAEAARILGPARAEAGRRQEERKRAKAKESRQRWSRGLTWVALVAAVVLTASGEYNLARLVGFGPVVAAMLPAAIDIYAVAAVRQEKDQAPAIGLMFLANAVYHLAERKIIGLDSGLPAWWLVIIVSGIGPYVVWRVHALMHHDENGEGQDSDSVATPPFPSPEANTPTAPFENSATEAFANTGPRTTANGSANISRPSHANAGKFPASNTARSSKASAAKQSKANTKQREKDRQDREAARADIKNALAEGQPLGARAVARKYDRSPSWGLDQIRAATADHEDRTLDADGGAQ